ncbi:serpin-ZXA-like [Iris pallida]|uniref:Serpin-ZXA-like n=1 Tax=Iris pallida TaxID=29817 RepID=A0AAX6IFQ5_IRIPA|nr:serpin-ZXA-like [Iris pallida]
MDLRESIANQSSFSLRLSRHVSASAGDRNVVLSPLSLHAVLSLLATGSAGSTLAQILSTVGSPSAADLQSLSTQTIGLVLADGSAAGGPRVAFANGVWVDSSVPLKKGFEETVTSVYKAVAKAVDFQTKAVEVANEVNAWAQNATAGLVKELLPPGSVDNSTRLVLGNALYFKGAWDKKFEASETKDSEFYLLNGTSVQVPFMTSKEKQFISSYDDFSVLRLPYKQGEDKRQFSMYIFLPDARDGLWSLLEKLSSEPGFLDRHRPRQKASVDNFKIPKFKISFGLDASEVLKGLGLVLPFSAECDLSEMVNSPVAGSLSVSSIYHKSVVEVNEEGTEAAAASAAVVLLRSLPVGPFDFVADHPFVLVIREDMTGVVLFSGHVINPLLAE